MLAEQNMKFVYLPTLFDGADESLRYYLPESAEMPNLTNNFLLQYLDDKSLADTVPPSFICFDRMPRNDIYVYKCRMFQVDDESDIIPMLTKLCSLFWPYDESYASAIDERWGYDWGPYDADEEFDRETRSLMFDVEEKLEQLRQRGVSEWILQRLLQPRQKLSRLVISDDFAISLPDYNMQIAMESLVKAVYLLFVNHPEGIIFKHLPDYRDELASLYARILGVNALTDKMQQSVTDTTDPTKNSINEKCARIRQAFVSQFDDNLARNYYITGQRACPKRIALPQELIVLC